MYLPLEVERLAAMLPGMDVVSPEPGWSSVVLGSANEIEKLADAFRAAWDQQRSEHPVPAMSTVPTTG